MKKPSNTKNVIGIQSLKNKNNTINGVKMRASIIMKATKNNSKKNEVRSYSAMFAIALILMDIEPDTLKRNDI